MKTKNLTFLLILISTSIFGQIPKDAISIDDKSFNDYIQNKENIPVVKGKILNLSGNDININYTIVTPFNEFQIKKDCKPNPDGTFELELENAFPYQQIWLYIDIGFYAGIYANTDLFIELDAEKINPREGLQYNGDGVKYLGTDGELNAYLNNHVLFRRKEQLQIDSTIQIMGMDRTLNYDRFISKHDSLYSILYELDKDFIRQNPSDFSWLIINDRKSAYYADLCVKHWRKEMSPELFDKIKKHRVYLTSNNGMLFNNYLYNYVSINANKGQKKNYISYKSFSKLGQTEKAVLDTIFLIEKDISLNQNYDSTKYLSLVKKANVFLSDTLALIRASQTIHQLDSIFPQSKSDLLKFQISSRDPNLQKQLMEATINTIKTDWCKDEIQKQYDNCLLKLSSIEKILNDSKLLETDIHFGKPISKMPFGAKLYKADTIDYKILLSNLKTANENKAIIIDFWATWCSPCLREMPYSRDLQNETKDLPVEFVYLCSSEGSDVDTWKTKIEELKIGGTHIFVKQEIENELMKLFSVSGFPSYAFIDKNGNYNAGAINRISNLDKDKLKKLIE